MFFQKSLPGAPDDTHVFCAGGIISLYHVVTSAHCFCQDFKDGLGEDDPAKEKVPDCTKKGQE